MTTFDHFLEQHGTRVYAAALRILGDGGLATDVAHEALLALREQSTLVSTEAALPWTLRVAKNRALDCLRQQLRERSRTQALPDDAAAPNHKQPLERMVLREEQAQLWQGLALLPERQRQIVMLRAIDGVAFVAAAKQLGISEGACKVHYRRGMQALAARLNPTNPEQNS